MIVLIVLHPDGAISVNVELIHKLRHWFLGKLGRLIKERGRLPLLVAAALQSPAAIDQLHVLGEQIGMRARPPSRDRLS